MKKEKVPLDEFTVLLKNPSHNLLIEVYDEKKEGPRPVNNHKKEKMTLVKLAIIVNDLAKEMRNGFKQVNSRIDNMEKDINTRIDYIVKANNLKDSR